MGMRTVRLDGETEKVLNRVRRTTGLSVSGALKQGLLALHNAADQQARAKPYDIYRKLDLGPGGYAIAPSTQTRRGVLEALKRKRRP